MTAAPYEFTDIDGKTHLFPVHDPLVPTAIYLRISQDRGGAGEGIKRQLEDAEIYAGLHRLTVIEVIEENNTSAYIRPEGEIKRRANKPKRPGFERLKVGARSGDFHAVIAFTADRLWRNLKDLNDVINIVETTPHRFAVHAVKGGVLSLDEPNGKLVARILGSVAQGEVELKSLRQARAHEQAFQNGKFPGGPLPFGYRLGAHPGELVIDKTERDVLHRIAQGILSDGWGITKATVEIRKMLPNRCGKMKPVALRGILTGPTVAARREYLPVAAMLQGKTVGTVGPAVWEPVFDDKTWYSLKAELNKGRKPKLGRPQRTSLLSGLLICVWCGGKLTYSVQSYKCSVTGGCGGMGISTKPIEAQIMKATSGILSSRENQAYLRNMLGLNDVRSSDGPDIDAELARLAVQREELGNLYRDPDPRLLPLAEYRRLIAQIAHEEAELENLRVDRVQEELYVSRGNAAFEAWADLIKLTDEASTAKKNIVLRGVYERILVWPVGSKSGRNYDSHRATSEMIGMSRPFIPLLERTEEEEADALAAHESQRPDPNYQPPSQRELIEHGIIEPPLRRIEGAVI